MYLSSVLLFSSIACFGFSSATEQCSDQCYSQDTVFSGTIPPVFVTFTANGKADTSPIPAYVQYLASNGIKTVIANGLIAGGGILAPEENKKIALAWVQEGRRCGVDVIVEVGGYVYEVVLELAKYAKSIGAAGIITTDDTFFKRNSSQSLIDYLTPIAEAACPLKMLYYHTEESPDGLNMATFVPKALDQISNFVGLKTDLISAQEVQSRLLDNKDLVIITYGSYDIVGPYALCMSGTSTPHANIFPRWNEIVRKATLNGDFTTALCYQKKITRAISSCTRLIDSETRGRSIFTYSSQLFRRLFVAVSGINLRGPPTPPLPSIPREIYQKCVAEFRKQGLLYRRSSDYYD